MRGYDEEATMADPTIRIAGVEPAIPAPDHAVVRLRLIGRMEAWTIRSENILPKRRKARAMLAYVAMASPRPVPRGRFAELLWSRRAQEQARSSLRQEIYWMLDALAPPETGGVVVTRDP